MRLNSFESLFNPLDLSFGTMTLKGRTLKGRTNYWGMVWVSLQDKQIEHATLCEDGLIEMTTPNNPSPVLTNVFREITLDRVLVQP